ncbi:MarR family winged helix-turn-helix transcriptional regulator [Streptosporangium sp. G11]|uniref:MarR family winged helix-turn-helix transcriptional regulator n=1 Tax=Streptosporangium sp. G11 TaxID=3436926 RepID=UPI003EB7F524
MTTSTDQAIWTAFLRLQAVVERQLAEALQRCHGMRLSEYRALRDLSQAADSELRMKVLADRIGLDQSSVTRLVGRLDALGFVYRDLCADDRRGVHAVVTEAGRERYLLASETYSDVLTCALDTLDADPQFGSLVRALRTARPSNGESRPG